MSATLEGQEGEGTGTLGLDSGNGSEKKAWGR